jgi:hypothetical protein
MTEAASLHLLLDHCNGDFVFRRHLYILSWNRHFWLPFHDRSRLACDRFALPALAIAALFRNRALDIYSCRQRSARNKIAGNVQRNTKTTGTTPAGLNALL